MDPDLSNSIAIETGSIVLLHSILSGQTNLPLSNIATWFLSNKIFLLPADKTETSTFIALIFVGSFGSGCGVVEHIFTK